jgi:hypothetical protein
MEKILDIYSNKELKKDAQLILHKETFIIRFYENNKFVGEVEYPDKSIHFVRDAAENYINGIFKTEDVYRYIEI